MLWYSRLTDNKPLPFEEYKSFNRILEWKTYSGAKKFLMNNEFILNGELLNKDNIDIVELRELKQDE